MCVKISSLSSFVDERCGWIRHLRQRSGNVSHQVRCFLRLLRDQLGASAKPARLEGLSLRHYCTITTSSVEPRLESRGDAEGQQLACSCASCCAQNSGGLTTHHGPAGGSPRQAQSLKPLIMGDTLWLPTYLYRRGAPSANNVEHLFDSALPLVGSAEGIGKPRFLRRCWRRRARRVFEF